MRNAQSTLLLIHFLHVLLALHMSKCLVNDPQNVYKPVSCLKQFWVPAFQMLCQIWHIMWLVHCFYYFPLNQAVKCFTNSLLPSYFAVFWWRISDPATCSSSVDFTWLSGWSVQVAVFQSRLQISKISIPQKLNISFQYHFGIDLNVLIHFYGQA